MITCTDCGFENPLANEHCSCCGMFLGFPNVNDCSRKEELKALAKRYKERVESAAQKGFDDKRIEFEKAVKKSAAVINVEPDYLQLLMLWKNSLYSTYQLQIEGETRDLAPMEFEKERLGVEGTLFGSYGKNIRYAALSLDGSGLKSYGPFTIIFSDTAIKKRATLLEENSFHFVKNQNILAGGKIPRGYRALWKDRHKLAITKLLEKIILTENENYAAVVMDSTGDRKTDGFIEVHIYGKLNSASIEAIRGNSKIEPGQKIIKKIKAYLIDNKKEWIEE